MFPCSSMPAFVLLTLASSQSPSAADHALRPAGAAMIWGDFDKDGLQDIYVIHPASRDRLLRNSGDGSFEDVTERALPADVPSSRSAAWGDFDKDGWPDLYVALSTGGGRLFRNLAGGRFEERSQEAGLPGIALVHDARWLDYDSDGLVDLVLEGKEGELLLHNQGDWSFEVVAISTGNTTLSSALPIPSAEGNPVASEPPGSRGMDHPPSSTRTVAAASAGFPPGPSPSSGLVAGPGQPGTGCVASIKDSFTGSCLDASSLPLLGMLYPISNDWFVDGAGHVGIGTITPTETLTVAGTVESTTGGFRFPDGSVQASASSGGVPSQAMILGDSPTAPANYTWTGMHVTANTGTDAWASKATMPTGRRNLVAAEVNGRIYAIGGIGSSYLATVEEYDPSIDSWSAKASMPTARADLAAAVVNGKIYAIGGRSSSSSIVATVEEYDPSIDSWSAKASLPTARADLAAAAVNGKIYVIGGSIPSSIATVEEYDPSIDSWSTRAPLPSPRASLAAAAVNGRIYAMGGFSSSPLNPSSSVFEFDPTSNSWSTKLPMPIGLWQLGATAVGGRVYAIGGVDFNTFFHRDVHEYDPVRNWWNIKPPIPTTRAAFGAASFNGKIYAIGGNGGIVEEFDAGIDTLLYVHQKN